MVFQLQIEKHEVTTLEIFNAVTLSCNSEIPGNLKL